MRKAFVEAITPILQKDEKQIFITGDLGFNAFEELRDTLGKRFINAGVAEQNMVSMAAGLAKQGYRPWVYSITPFATLRCLEQIRNDVCFENLPVTIVGNGGGFTYGMNGKTHFGLDDIGVMKCLPINLWMPNHSDKVGGLIKEIIKTSSPAYLRLGISPYETGFSAHTSTIGAPHVKATVVGFGQAWNVGMHAIAYSSYRDPVHYAFNLFPLTAYPFVVFEIDRILESLRHTQYLILLDEHILHAGLSYELITLLTNKLDVGFKCNIMAATYGGNLNGDSKWHHERCGLTPEALIKLVEGL